MIDATPLATDVIESTTVERLPAFEPHKSAFAR
jgi:hypothetical protein